MTLSLKGTFSLSLSCTLNYGRLHKWTDLKEYLRDFTLVHFKEICFHYVLPTLLTSSKNAESALPEFHFR